MTTFEAVIIAIVEGLTEFLPISSTGHMIITEKLLGTQADVFTKAYIVSIQFGAILSVVVLYWKRFFKSFDFYFKLLAAFVPTAILGFLLDDYIDLLLDDVLVVALALLAGGIVLVFIDRVLHPSKEVTITYGRAFVVGLFQSLAMVPGVSRSASTIIGGMTQGMTRKQAAEFSFFLAVPTMFAASGYKLLRGFQETPEILSDTHLGILLLGNVVAFIVAVLAIRFFIAFLTRYGFRLFGWYRIVLGLLILTLLALGLDLQVI
ncbi:MAG: undecaprenyl-diphosphate phosphatase [Flavobacteriales bacterium]|nr:undecaprenyl-diphosphate phosphatase [Flavobacteriales bacterium]MCB9166945.1 undecaprenyl-diphosphate phosphatase [Flavobacteriales bacterium]